MRQRGICSEIPDSMVELLMMNAQIKRFMTDCGHRAGTREWDSNSDYNAMMSSG